ncbi:hypothetical protein [Companilactobacillus ginsenosidimutans]|uniref:Yip1 domain-containing protein n=1 Tax=Companilactobacillus ginsenosidimutans TaxID=1007676 RepID=A0A0H4QKY7_9LACO|nr:hypothetical protein [Companilactobacillus ginsenosidimutans]AKP67766.1 hypothetical protein ABM34_09640 [Companilactobacillus ginsenosidimutans]
MEKQKSSLFFITYLVAQLLFSLEVLKEVAQKSVVAQDLGGKTDLTSFTGRIDGTLVITAIALACYVALYFLIYILLRVSAVDDIKKSTNSTFNSLFLSASSATTISLFLNLAIAHRWIAFIYPITLAVVFFFLYRSTKQTSKRARYIPIAVVSIAALSLWYYVITQL